MKAIKNYVLVRQYYIIIITSGNKDFVEEVNLALKE